MSGLVLIRRKQEREKGLKKSKGYERFWCLKREDLVKGESRVLMAEERLKSVGHAFAVSTLFLSLLKGIFLICWNQNQTPIPKTRKERERERESAYELCDDDEVKEKEQLMKDHDVLVHQDRGRVMGLSLQDHTHLCSCTSYMYTWTSIQKVFNCDCVGGLMKNKTKNYMKFPWEDVAEADDKCWWWFWWWPCIWWWCLCWTSFIDDVLRACTWW